MTLYCFLDPADSLHPWEIGLSHKDDKNPNTDTSSNNLNNSSDKSLTQATKNLRNSNESLVTQKTQDDKEYLNASNNNDLPAAEKSGHTSQETDFSDQQPGSMTFQEKSNQVLPGTEQSDEVNTNKRNTSIDEQDNSRHL